MTLKATRIASALCATALFAVATPAFAVTPTPAAATTETGASSQATPTRLWGADRYETSLEVAKAVAENAGGKLDTAVLVSGRSWTDAVTAAPLAGSLDAPVLLADPRNGISADVRDFMSEVGVTRIVVIGSAENLPGAALAGLSGIDGDIERIVASSKHAMSVAVAGEIGDPGSLDGFGNTVIVASGDVFADALSAGPLAAKAGIPILLTTPDELHPAIKDYTAANADHVIIMGGTAAISRQVQDTISQLPTATEPTQPMAVTRIGGKDRFETATMFAEFAAEVFGVGCFDGTTAGLATGGAPADAFSSAPLLARLCAPLVLTYTHALPAATEDRLSSTERLYVFGGTAAVSDAAVSQWASAQPTPAVAARFPRWNHQALIDLPLWSHCPPEVWPSWLTGYLDDWVEIYAGWDSAAVDIDGTRIASGWWTDEQLAQWIPNGSVTAESAHRDARYDTTLNLVSLWPQGHSVPLHPMETPRQLPTLQAAMEHRGYNVESGSLAEMLAATLHGVNGDTEWPSDLSKGKLLTSWMRWRYQQPPTTAEPVAWALRSLFEARESGCAAEALIEMCASGETPPPMLTQRHPIGRVLRSLACAE